MATQTQAVRSTRPIRPIQDPSLVEYPAFSMSGWIVAPMFILIALLYLFVFFGDGRFTLAGAATGGLLFLLLVTGLTGFKIVQPGQALVLTFFGRYHGSVTESGFHFINPFASAIRITTRIVNLLTPTLKVNDANGNPIEVGASIAWQIDDTCRAVFAVDSAPDYVRVQSEAALRLVVGSHPYDGDDPSATLRGNVREVAQELIKAIEASVRPAGIRIIDAQIAHLAYAQEIASAMLKRQQAQQVIAARKLIVDGAVDMVKLAIEKLESEKIVALEPADRVQLATNLMTVLVSESEAQPVVQLSGKRLSS